MLISDSLMQHGMNALTITGNLVLVGTHTVDGIGFNQPISNELHFLFLLWYNRLVTVQEVS